MKNQILECFLALRESSPLIHNITNYVVMNNTANALLAIGASPVMAHAHEELQDMLSIASSLVINMGTLDNYWVNSMDKAAKAALDRKLPWVLDPVGVGATRYRTDTAQSLLFKSKPNIIRANGSEIIALANAHSATKGVDSSVDGATAIGAARQLSQQADTTVIISGATDYIISAERQTALLNGDPIMTKVTGMGCTATAIVGACLAVCDDNHLAAVTGMTIMGIAGEVAATNSSGPGSFQAVFLDTLFNLTANEINTWLRMQDAY